MKMTGTEGEIPLGGGRTTVGVVRVGDTVRRPVGPHSAFVHQLLGELEAAGFGGAPRFLGLDPAGREILSFIVGEVPADLGDFSREQLCRAGALLRSYHDATAAMALRGDHEVVCHQDFSPCNAVFCQQGLPVAMIDFDAAAPGSRRWDLAYSLWMWCDLGNGEQSVAEQASKIKSLCGGYGLSPDRPLIELIIAWQCQEVQGHLEDAVAKGLHVRTHPPLVWTKACLAWSERNVEALMSSLSI